MVTRPRLSTARGLRRVFAAAAAAVVAAMVFGSAPFWLAGFQVANAQTPPMVGFSFSPYTAAYLGENPEPALRELMDRLQPDLVRLPIYWDAVEPRRGAFDFSSIDGLLAVVREYNLSHGARPARVVLEVGMRNMGYPELYVPAWISVSSTVAEIAATSEYAQYLELSVRRYRHDHLLYEWQLENEPLDDVPTTAGATVNIPGDALQDEKETLQRLDAVHGVLITTYNSSTLDLDLKALSPAGSNDPPDAPQPAGHPLQALQLGDALGLDVYVVTGATSLEDATARVRTDWKKAALSYWTAQARAVHKPVWIAEMQGAPWPGLNNFTTSDLLYSARLYRSASVSVVLLWGVESWLQSPTWMAAGLEARRIVGS